MKRLLLLSILILFVPTLLSAQAQTASTPKGVAKDEAEAMKWIRKAAEQGHESAKNILENVFKITDRPLSVIRRTT